jgi:hypothetical protein
MKRYIDDGATGLVAALDAITTARKDVWGLFYQTGQALLALMIAVLGGILGRVLADRSP